MTPNPHANPIPNILTGLRLIAGVIMFLILAGAAPQGIPFMSDYLSPDDQFRFGRTGVRSAAGAFDVTLNGFGGQRSQQ